MSKPEKRTLDFFPGVFDQHQAAAYLNVSVSTLSRWRRNGMGPRYVPIGEKRIGYRQPDLDVWLEGQAVSPVRRLAETRGQTGAPLRPGGHKTSQALPQFGEMSRSICVFNFGRLSLTVVQTIFKSTKKYSWIAMLRIARICAQGSSGCAGMKSGAML